MAAKTIFIIAPVLLIQSVASQCIGFNNLPYAPYAAPWDLPAPYATTCAAPYGPVAAEWAFGFGPGNLAASHGPGLSVASASPVPPTGVSTVSETAYNGGLAVAGQIPFVSSITLEGALPTVGGGAITYRCGDGNVVIVSEDIAPAGYGGIGYGAGPIGYEAAYPDLYGYGAPIGCGYNGIY